MEQYWIPKNLDFENLRFALDNYNPDSIFIRNVGSYGGNVLFKDSLENKKLDFKKTKNNLLLLIDSKEKFNISLEEYNKEKGKGFSLAYEREDKEGKYVFVNELINPYDSRFSEPFCSVLRNVFDNKLFEISFPGRVHLRFYRMNDASFPYYVIDKTR